MLTDTCFYYSQSDKIKKALKYLENTDLDKMANGRYEIDGDDIYMTIQEYQTKPEFEGKWEAHEKYIDIQYIIKGCEKIGCGDIKNFTPVTDYDDEKDIVFLQGEGRFKTVNEGTFLILTQKDAHMPGIAIDEPQYVKKAVVKVKEKEI